MALITLLAFMVVMVAIQHVLAQYGATWTKKRLGDLHAPATYQPPSTSAAEAASTTKRQLPVSFNLHPLMPLEFCLLEVLPLQWNVTSSQPLENILLGVVYGSGPNMPITKDTDVKLMPMIASSVVDGESTTSSVIQCAIDQDHCKPTVKDIVASLDTKKIIIVFNTDTNMPALDNRESVMRALNIQPVPTGGVIGDWTSPERLEISVDERYLEHLVRFYQSGRVVSVTVREIVRYSEQVNFTTGKLKLRMTEHGEAELFAVDAVTLQIISDFYIVSIKPCNDTVIVDASDALPTTVTTSQDYSYVRVPTKPLLRIKGVISLSGNSGITIPNSNFEPIANGTWSLSMWMYMLDPPTTEYRCLFFKGSDYPAIHRTPSAWFTANKNRLAIRASTEADPNMGAESFLDIPQGQWVLLTFSFLNLTTSDHQNNTTDDSIGIKHESDRKMSTVSTNRLDAMRRLHGVPAGYEYVISEYVNARTDTVMSFPMKVIGNDAPLILFKAQESGPRAFVKEIVLWDSALTTAEVRALYAAGPGETKPVDELMGMISHASQISESKLSSGGPYYHTVANSRGGVLKGKLPTIFPGPVVPPLDISSLLTEDTEHSAPSEDIQSSILENLQLSLGEQPSHYDPFAERIHLGDSMLQRAKDSLQNCEPYNDRMDLYAEAARNGNVEALYYWAMMIGFGSETPDNPCGITNLKKSKVSDDKLVVSHHLHDVDALRMIFALIYCVELGFNKALVPLSISLQSGIGIQAFLLYNDRNLASTVRVIYDSIPLPFYLYVDQDFNMDWSSQNASMSSAHVLRSYLHEYLTKEVTSSMTQDDVHAQSNQVADLQNRQLGKPSLRQKVVGHGPVGVSAIDVYSRLARGGANDSNMFSIAYYGDNVTTTITDLVTGLLHLAATYDVPDSFAALSYRYQHGVSVPRDDDTAVFYAYRASTIAHDLYHKIGGQPLAQEDRIDDRTEQNINKGNKGADDEMIQTIIVQADEGHVPSMITAADSYYFGARGLPRDQQQALHYYNQAAAGGDTYGMCGAAAMYLKGEGGQQNTSRAIEMYEEAAAKGSNKALNGLGYMYFFGQTVEKNESKGFEYFLRAALTETDGDALSNAAYCLQHGVGTPRDLERAAKFYLIAAQKFGHFDSVRNLGIMKMDGVGVKRSASEALVLFSAANHVGPWIGWIRRGLDQFLSSNYQKSLMCYVYAGDMGYEIAQSNAAFVIRRKLKLPVVSDESLRIDNSMSMSMLGDRTCDSASDSGRTCPLGTRQAVVSFSARSLHQVYQILQYRELLMSSSFTNKDSDFMLGHLFFTGATDVFPGTSPDFSTALWWYSKASNAGYSLASLYVGAMHHFAVGMKEKNPARAVRYYKKALEDTNMEYQLRFVAKSLQYMAEYGQGFALMDMSSTLLEILVKKIYRLEQ